MSAPDRLDPRKVFAIVAVAALLLVAIFYGFGQRYYTAKLTGAGVASAAAAAKIKVLELLPSVVTFAVVAGGLIGAAIVWSRPFALGLPIAMAVLSATGAVAGWRAEIPDLLVVVLAAFAVILLVAAAAASRRRSRVAWAALTSMSGVLATVTLFGVPKIHDLVGIDLWLGLIVPSLCAAATTALIATGRDYADAE